MSFGHGRNGPTRPLFHAPRAAVGWLLLVAACGARFPSVKGSDSGVSGGGGASVPPHADGGAGAAPAGGADASAVDVAAEVPPVDDAASPDQGGLPPAGSFRHPGALVSGEQLAFLKTKLAASAQPWTGALAAARADPHASLSYPPRPPVDSKGDVACGSFSNPDVHCKDEQNDVSAAYTDALIFALTADARYEAKAIAIMNAWSAVMKSHSNSNAPLQAGWTGSVFARAGELIRYTSTAWSAADVDAFSKMLRTAYLPYIAKGWPGGNGNWELSMADALIQIAVFLDDRASFDAAVALWKQRVPEYIYISSDGPKPVQGTPASSWNGATSYFDGLCQETCRDLGHTQYGFAAMINAAETALIQGVDLYALETKRITAGLELNAGYIDKRAASSPACGLSAVSPDATWEIAYNEYANRLSMPLPNTAQLVNAHRPTRIDHHMDWETLTHAEIGSIGIR
jgi:hypothetical protein